MKSATMVVPEPQLIRTASRAINLNLKKAILLKFEF
jgi:hypothetical protein